MPERKRININEMPKWFKAALFVLPFLGLLLIDSGIHNDFYFLYPTGKYILGNGFPHTDILTMHTDMSIVVQQWLSSVVFYIIYSKLGAVGIAAMIYICAAVLTALIIALLKRITDNYIIALLFSFVICVLMDGMYEISRPQIFTYIILVSELYCLERFVKTKKVYHLFFIPLLSVLLINLHAAMWGLIFVFAAPYVAAAIPIKAKHINQEPCCSLLKLIVCGVISFAAGFINPYGFEAIKYVTTSFGDKEISRIVYEMTPSRFDGAGMILFVLLFVMIVTALVIKKPAYSTRFVLLFVGTAVLAMLNIKSVAYFLIAGIPAYAYLLKDCEISIPVSSEKGAKPNKKRIALLSVLLVAVSILACVVLLTQNSAKTEPVPAKEEKSTLEYIDDMTAVLDKADEKLILYAGFDWGQYLEYKGYHPYIDGRAELFLKKNNGKFDYLKEYNQLMSGSLYYKDFVDKYKFNYLIVSDREQYLRSSLKRDRDYTILIDSDEITLFKLNS